MNIIEATKQSIETDKWICLKKFPFAIIKPTDTALCCIVAGVSSGYDPGARWNPTATDLLSEDWILSDKTMSDLGKGSFL